MSRVGTIVRCLLAAGALFGGTALAGNFDPTRNCDSSASLASYLGADPCFIGDVAVGRFQFVDFNLLTSEQQNQLFVTTSWDPSSRFASLALIGFNCGQSENRTTATGCFDADGGAILSYDFIFTVDPGPIIDQEEVTIDPPFGNVLGRQIYCPDGNFDGPNFCSSTSPEPPPSQTFFPTLQLGFRPPLAVLETDTTVTLDSTSGPAGFDALIYRFHAIPDPVPEPGSWVLFGTGLVGLALGRWRRRQ